MPTKPVQAITEPVPVPVGSGVILFTTIDPTTQKHSINCDKCHKTIRLTKTGHPENFYRHRENCSLTNEQKQLRKELRDELQGEVESDMTTNSGAKRTSRALPKTPQVSEIIISFSTLQTTSTPQSPAIPPASNPVIRRPKKLYPCPGVEVEWSAGSIWATYAYHQHEEDTVPWQPVGFDSKRNTICLRDDRCLGELTEYDESPCHRCRSLPFSQEFKNFESRAQDIAEFTPWHYLTYSQMVDLLRKMTGQLKKLRAELQSATRRIKVATAQVDEYKRILMLIASNEIAGLRRLMAASLRRGCSPKSLVSLLERAIQGLYSPRGGFSERDLDIAFLVKAIGGPKLLYALNHSHGLASESTVRRNHRIPQILASITQPQKEEIDHNISAFFDPLVKPFPLKYLNGIPGNVAAFDGIAMESKCRYCPERGVILGLCREHSNNVDPKVTSLDSIEKVRTALFEKPSDDNSKVCFGNDATVVAIAPYAREDHYTPVPVIISPSDKSEKGSELAKWMRTLIDAWREHEYGERVSGPIWALASDGDATFRRARHIICLERKIDVDSGLGKRLTSLQGLNLYTSCEGITGTCDPKHVFKRFATLMRNTSGIIVYGTNITPYHTLTELSRLPDLSMESARELLDPADKQNVPKAVALIQRLTSLAQLPEPDNAVISHRRHVLNFLAIFFSSFLSPFIDVEMDLTNQVISLSLFAHLAAAIHVKHGSACLTGALYADCQAIIKNLVFTVARLQEINPNIKFHIILEGSDRLERLFGDCRTQDHGRNFDILQLCQKMAVATLINAAYERNPDLDRGHRRLSLTGSIGIDHINPRSWKGDTCVGNVDLKEAWDAGRDSANSILIRFFGDKAAHNFSETFSKPGHDLLRPNGTYIGSKHEDGDDRSEQEDAGALEKHIARSLASDSASTDWPATPLGMNSNMHNSAVAEEDDTGSQDRTEISSAESGMINSASPITDDNFQDLPKDMGIEDFLPDTLDEIEAGKPPGKSSIRTLQIEGKAVLIDPLVASLSPRHWKRVTMRTLRAQGRVIEDFSKSKFNDLFDADDANDESLMKATDLAAILVRAGENVCLAVMEIIAFRFQDGKDKSLRTVAKYRELAATPSSIKVIGQLVHLSPSATKNDTLTSWEWPRQYIQLNVEAESDLWSRPQFNLEVPSVLVHPISPHIIVSRQATSPSEKLRWTISTEALQESLDDAWQSLSPESDNIVSNLQMLPVVANPTAIPYQDKDGKPWFFVKDLPSHLVPKPKLPGNMKVHCFICGAERPLNDMRNHVGRHILWEMRDQTEQRPLHNKVGAFPCGFCGLDGRTKGSSFSQIAFITTKR